MSLFYGPLWVLAGYMLLFFLISLAKKKMSVADIAWGLGFVVLAWYSWFQMSEQLWFQSLLTLMVTLWGLRLGFTIGTRNWDKPEDWRYAQWRKDWGKWVIPRSFLQVFVLQGLLLLVIASSILWINTRMSVQYPSFFWVGCFIWLFGFVFEVLADAQLKAFVKNKKEGQIMTSGLWKYSRHPNYFGEAVLWWGIFVMAMAVKPEAWLVVSPVTISFLLRFVSGVPMLERKWKGNKAFEAYAQKTNAFLPWFPREA